MKSDDGARAVQYSAVRRSAGAVAQPESESIRCSGCRVADVRDAWVESTCLWSNFPAETSLLVRRHLPTRCRGRETAAFRPRDRVGRS